MIHSFFCMKRNFMRLHGGNIYDWNSGVLDFSANLNLLGMPRAVKDAIASHTQCYEAYPDTDARALCDALAKRYGTDPGRIVPGNGAADILYRLAFAFQPKKALITAPTFSEYERALRLTGTETDFHILCATDNFATDARLEEKIAGSQYDMVFIANPGNPVGNLTDADRMRRLAEVCAAAGSRLIVDECFLDFVEDREAYSILPYLQRERDGAGCIIVLKSFTKLYAMAGVRLGFCLCAKAEDAAALKDVGQPWSVSAVAQIAGLAALAVKGRIEKTLPPVRQGRRFLCDVLRTCGAHVYLPEQTGPNYIFFAADAGLDKHLAAEGILIRNCSNYRGLGEGYFRIAVRTEEENRRFANTLARVRV